MDLLDVLEEIEKEARGELVLCNCVVGRATGHDGWTLERNRQSKYYGMWVHGNPECRRPTHPHTKGTQKL